MPHHIAELLKQLQQADGVLVSVDSVQGSGPREVGAWMAVFPDVLVNTIGGGHLEFQAAREARAWLARSSPVQPSLGHDLTSSATHAQTTAAFYADTADHAFTTRYALGPALGQCCGGVVHLKFERICAGDAPTLAQRLQPKTQPIALFGGGHVGHALVRVLGSLPYQVQWVDSRDEIFPAQLPPNVVCEHSDPVHAAVADVPPGACVLIMSFSHAEDLEVVAACLKRQRVQGDLKFVGLIGSQTKWATFRHRLQAQGFSAQELAHVTCPIGLPGITGKEPEVIAVSVAAQLLGQRALGVESPETSVYLSTPFLDIEDGSAVA